MSAVRSWTPCGIAFSKIYKTVPPSRQIYSQWQPYVTWERGEEIHIDENGYTTPAYWRYREDGFNCPHPVRYPVGRNYRDQCVCSITDDLR